MIQRFNLVVSWITGEICSQILLKQRITTIEKFISLGKHLLDLGNFNGVMEVVAGLHRCVVRHLSFIRKITQTPYSAPVQRLKKTWEGVNKHSLATFESLGSLMGQEHNYKIVRRRRFVTPSLMKLTLSFSHSIAQPCAAQSSRCYRIWAWD